MQVIYAVWGHNGLGITKHWGRVQKLKPYFGKYFNTKKCTSLDEAVAYARYHYNELNRYRNLYYNGTLGDEQVLFTKDIKAYMAQNIPPVPLPLIFFAGK